MDLSVTTAAVHVRERIPLKIWQQNVNKSDLCQHDLISSGRLTREGIGIVALQEPYISKFGLTVTASDWISIFPTTHRTDSAKTRSIILVRSNLLTDSWSQIDINLEDITALEIRGEWGKLAIFNAYIDCNHDRAIEELTKATKAYEASATRTPAQNKHILWLGDFNRHHPHWDNPSDTRLFTRDALRAAEKLIGAVADAGLDLALPPKVPTHKHNVTKKMTRLDQVFLSDHSFDALTACDTACKIPGLRTDHLPILTELNMPLAHAPNKSIVNFREVEWDKFRTELRTELAPLGRPKTIEDQPSLDEACKQLTLAIQNTIDRQVPVTEISPKSKRWWSKELTAMRRYANKLGRKASKLNNQPDHPIHAEYDKAKTKYAKEIAWNKKTHWRDWLERAEDPDIWTANKYISAADTVGGNVTRIPSLSSGEGEQVSLAVTNEEKSRILVKTFFPMKRTANEEETRNVEDIEEVDTPGPICKMSKLTRDQITRHLAKLKPYKAPGPDGIPNIVLTKCADLLIDRLYYIYNAMVKHDLFYEPWKKFTTIVLRKPGKPKYNVPKAYRPIALINTLVKVLTAVLAEQSINVLCRTSPPTTSKSFRR